MIENLNEPLSASMWDGLLQLVLRRANVEGWN
jgi:hypothetical protein